MKGKIFIVMMALGLWAAVLVAASNAPAGKACTPCPAGVCPHNCCAQ